MYLELWITKFISRGVDCVPLCSFTMDMIVEEFIAKCCDLQRTIFLKHGPEKSSAFKAASMHPMYSATMRIPSRYTKI